LRRTGFRYGGGGGMHWGSLPDGCFRCFRKRGGQLGDDNLSDLVRKATAGSAPSAPLRETIPAPRPRKRKGFHAEPAEKKGARRDGAPAAHAFLIRNRHAEGIAAMPGRMDIIERPPAPGCGQDDQKVGLLRRLKMAKTVLVERTFRVDGKELSCRFFQTELEGRDYFCRYEIDWPKKTRGRRVGGVDGVQALLLAMQAAHVDFLMARKDEGAKIVWLDQKDLGLPLSQGLRDLDPDGYF